MLLYKNSQLPRKEGMPYFSPCLFSRNPSKSFLLLILHYSKDCNIKNLNLHQFKVLLIITFVSRASEMVIQIL